MGSLYYGHMVQNNTLLQGKPLYGTSKTKKSQAWLVEAPFVQDGQELSSRYVVILYVMIVNCKGPIHAICTENVYLLW